MEAKHGEPIVIVKRLFLLYLKNHCIEQQTFRVGYKVWEKDIPRAQKETRLSKNSSKDVYESCWE